MDDSIRHAVERAITLMHDNLEDQLTLADLAHEALLSKFHFTRVFAQTTGTTPGRFLSALRLQQAKMLLNMTTMPVGDICVRVGYNSVGSFSSRFTTSVGMAPTAYRRKADAHHDISRMAEPAGAVIKGRVTASGPSRGGLVFVGLFPHPVPQFPRRIPEGRSIRCTVLPGPGPFRLGDVPEGEWYLLAHSVAESSLRAMDPASFARSRALASGSSGPVRVGPDTAVAAADLVLRPISILEPPVLTALGPMPPRVLARRPT